MGNDGPQREDHCCPPATPDHSPGQAVSNLSLSHLKAAVEGVAGFGKAPAAVRENQVPARESEPVSNGTVTETGMAVSVGQESGVQVSEMFGASDPD